MNGLDPRLARQALGNVAAYVARLEVGEQFSIQGPIKIGRRKRLHDEIGPAERDPPVQAPASLAASTAPLPPPAVAKPCSSSDRERVPAHQLTVTKSQRMHMKRQARKVRWLARQALLDARPHGHGVDGICDRALDPTVPSNFESQPASNSVANRDH